MYKVTLFLVVLLAASAAAFPQLPPKHKRKHDRNRPWPQETQDAANRASIFINHHLDTMCAKLHSVPDLDQTEVVNGEKRKIFAPLKHYMQQVYHHSVKRSKEFGHHVMKEDEVLQMHINNLRKKCDGATRMGSEPKRKVIAKHTRRERL